MQRFFDRKLYIHANIEMSIPYGGSSLFCVLNGSVYCMGLYLSIAEFERYKEASFECEYDAARKCWDEPVGQVGGFPPKYQHDPYDFACYRLGMKDKYIKNINNIQFVANFPQVFELEFGDGGALSLYNVTQGEGSELRGFVEVP